MARMLLLQQNKDNLIYATISNEGSLIIESRYPGKGEQWSYSERIEIMPEGAQALFKLLSFEPANTGLQSDGDLPCATCGGEVGHRANCPHSIYFVSDPRS